MGFGVIFHRFQICPPRFNLIVWVWLPLFYLTVHLCHLCRKITYYMPIVKALDWLFIAYRCWFWRYISQISIMPSAIKLYCVGVTPTVRPTQLYTSIWPPATPGKPFTHMGYLEACKMISDFISHWECHSLSMLVSKLIMKVKAHSDGGCE